MLLTRIKDLFNPITFAYLIRYSVNYRFKILIIVIMQMSLSLSGVIIAVTTKNLIDTAIGGIMSEAITYALILALLFLSSLFLSNYSGYFIARVRESMRNRLQIDFFRSVYGKQWMSVYLYKTGDVLTRADDDIFYIIDVWITIFPNLIALLIQLFTAYIILSNFDQTLALLAFVVGPITFVPGFIIGRKLKTIQQKIQKANSALTSFINESIHNLTIIKTFNIENDNIEQINQYQTERTKLVLQKNRTSAYANFVLGLGYQAGFYSALAFGAFRLSAEAITFGTFTAFLQLVSQIQYPIDGISRTIPQIIITFSSVERLKEIENLPSEKSSSSIPTKHFPTDCEKLSISNIYFEYNKNIPILYDFSIDISQGDKIALLGSSGEGKTTFAMVLLGLLNPQSGYINMTMNDGTVVPVTSATRKFFSYVPQNNALFSGSIEYNLRMANKYASSEELYKALLAACALQFVSELPLGIDTIVGEKGIGLSEGQIQRICIARALLRGAPFLILDEATSALDIESENSIIHNLSEYYPKTAIIAITHRNSILQICDKVYTLKKGRLIKSMPNPVTRS